MWINSFIGTNTTRGNVYRILRQLEKEDMVQSVWDTTTGGPAKRIYSITDAGEEYLASWAGVLEQYQKMLDQFFSVYTQFFMPMHIFGSQSDAKKDDPGKE